MENRELWLNNNHIVTAFLQQQLRKLHALIKWAKDEKDLIVIEKFAMRLKDDDDEEGCGLFCIPEEKSELILQNAFQKLFQIIEVNNA